MFNRDELTTITLYQGISENIEITIYDGEQLLSDIDGVDVSTLKIAFTVRHPSTGATLIRKRNANMSGGSAQQIDMSEAASSKVIVKIQPQETLKFEADTFLKFDALIQLSSGEWKLLDRGNVYIEEAQTTDHIGA